MNQNQKAQNKQTKKEIIHNEIFTTYILPSDILFSLIKIVYEQ